MPKETNLPQYIVLEGPDGVGTTTQRDILVEKLNQEAAESALGIREPGQTPIGNVLRDILKNPDLQRDPCTNLYLFTADRRETAIQVIKPHTSRGGDHRF